MNDISHRLKLLTGDITRLAVNAIVNAANEALRGGGGVDGAIHRAAGPGLLEECIKIGHCPTGEARITKGHRLPAKHIIHTVGPVWEGGGTGEATLLESCYRNSLLLASRHGVATIAFPCIATGVYGYPRTDAAETAVRIVSEYLRGQETPREVTFCCFSQEDAAQYAERLKRLAERTPT